MKNKRLWVAIIAIVLLLGMLIPLLIQVLPTPASAAQSSSEIRDQIDQMEKENAALQEQLNALKKEQEKNSNEIKDLMSKKSNLELQYGLLHMQVKNLNEQIAAYNVLIADKQQDVKDAEKRLEQLNEIHKERIRTMEEDGNLSYWSVIFEAKSFSDLLDRLNMIQEIASSDRKRLEDMRVAAEELEAAKAVLLEEREALKDAKAVLAERQVEMQQKSAEAQAVLEQLIAKGEEFEQFMEDAEDRLAKLEQEIANKEAEYDEAKYQEYLASLNKPSNPSTDVTHPNYGGGKGGNTYVDTNGITWMVPASYTRVSSKFDPNRLHPVYGYVRPHNGVDLAAPCPTPIVATRAGIVTVANMNKESDAGYYIQIDHLDGYKSVYMHMCCPPELKVGDVVAQGQVIGCIGTTGASTGNHLHFGISKNGVYVDPMTFIS